MDCDQNNNGLSLLGAGRSNIETDLVEEQNCTVKILLWGRQLWRREKTLSFRLNLKDYSKRKQDIENMFLFLCKFQRLCFHPNCSVFANATQFCVVGKFSTSRAKGQFPPTLRDCTTTFNSAVRDVTASGIWHRIINTAAKTHNIRSFCGVWSYREIFTLEDWDQTDSSGGTNVIRRETS